MENILFRTKYGSHLYGTNTPESDYDEKVIYLPGIESLLLGKKLQTYKHRYDESGNVLSDTVKMPPRGKEIEHIPFQKFARDFFEGQTYAIEIAFALKHQKSQHVGIIYDLINSFLPDTFSPMLGFAMKQTFDYVHRATRMKKLQDVVNLVDELILSSPAPKSHDHPVPSTPLRLDTSFNGKKLIQIISEKLGVEIGTTTNGNKTISTLQLAGRDYIETLDVRQFTASLLKLIYNYGHRTEAASVSEVDLKSLMHAVRVYEQVIELSQTKNLVFPRPSANELVQIKNAQIPVDKIRYRLLTLEHEAGELEQKAAPKKAELNDDFETWLLFTLWKLYRLR